MRLCAEKLEDCAGKRAKAEGEGERGEAGGERTARLRAPRSATWEVPAPTQAWPNVPPGRLELGRGHNYTSAPGKDLKTKWRGPQSGSKALRSSEGVGPVHRNLLQGIWVQGKKKSK